jgi:hypothetical protein
VGVEGGADFIDVGAVDADGFVELVAGDAELFGPEGDVGGHFGIDFFGVVGAGGVVFVEGVGFVGFGGVVVLGHAEFLWRGLKLLMREMGGEVGGDVPGKAGAKAGRRAARRRAPGVIVRAAARGR